MNQEQSKQEMIKLLNYKNTMKTKILNKEYSNQLINDNTQTFNMKQEQFKDEPFDLQKNF